jgi:hypothetical protein
VTDSAVVVDRVVAQPVNSSAAPDNIEMRAMGFMVSVKTVSVYSVLSSGQVGRWAL